MRAPDEAGTSKTVVLIAMYGGHIRVLCERKRAAEQGVTAGPLT
jgi:hypothetical protein